MLKISGYEMLELLGEGSTGYVQKAKQVRLNRLVAIKVLTESVDEGERVNRFLREARAAAQMRHHHLVTLYDVGRAPGGEEYLVLEFVDGLSLEKMFNRYGPVPERAALTICQGVVQALLALELNGFVHRDIKPGNILVSWEGVSKLADLGLAKGQEDLATATRTGQILGTPMYIAPEQIEGTSEVDIRADLYALGVSLYHCMTGQSPFDASRGIWHLLNQRKNQELPDPRSVKSTISAGAAGLIAGLSRKDPADRYNSAAAACFDFMRVLRGKKPYGPQRAALKVKGSFGTSNVDEVDCQPVADYMEELKTRAGTATASVFFRLRLTRDSDGVQLHEHVYDQDEVAVGRELESDIIIDHGAVSRHHAAVRRLGVEFALVANPTPNGTSLNGERVEGMVKLRPGDEIGIADRFTIAFDMPDADRYGLADSAENLLFNPYARPTEKRRKLQNARAPETDPASQAPGSDRHRRTDRHTPRPPTARQPRAEQRIVAQLEGVDAGGLSDVRITVRGLQGRIGLAVPLGRRCQVQLTHPILRSSLTLTAVVTGCEAIGEGYALDLTFSDADVVQRMNIRRVQAAESSMRVIVGGTCVGFCSERGDAWTVYDATTAKVANLERVLGKIRASFLGAGPEDSLQFLETERLEAAVGLAMDLDQTPELIPPDGGSWEPIPKGDTKGHDTAPPAMRFHRVQTSQGIVGYLAVTSLEDDLTVFDPTWKELASLSPQTDGSCKVRPVEGEGMAFVEFVMAPNLKAGIGFVLKLRELPTLDPPIQPWATGK